ncbi:MAG: cellulose biosynthesis cyclic di-GMP-binding regulatory protein BcsB [Pseudomonadota bacterium]
MTRRLWPNGFYKKIALAGLLSLVVPSLASAAQQHWPYTADSMRVARDSASALASIPAPVPTIALVEGTRFVLPLGKLTGASQPVKLSGAAAAYTFSMPVPALWRAKQVVLSLVGTASRALIDTSQLVILVNGNVVRQFPLSSRSEGFRHEFEIPVDLLRVGFNEVRVEVAQHYTNTCEYPLAPQLWTQLNLEQSQLAIVADPLPVTPLLSKLDSFFDKADWRSRQVVTILTPTAPGVREMQALGLVAQGIGQRYDYVPVSLMHRRLPPMPRELATQIDPSSGGAVVLGTFAQLAPYLAGMEIEPGAEPMIAVRPFPGDATRFLLILAAGNDEQLVEVAKAFSVRQVPWPDSASTTIRQLKLPEVAEFDARFSTPYAASGAFPLRALGFKSTTYNGPDAAGATIRFWNGSWQGRAQVRVHLAYASGMGTQSAVNVLVNGIMQGSIPLNNPDGGVYEKYAVSIPAGALKQGWNQLEIKPILIPVSNGGECRPFYNGNLAMTLYEDTTMQKFGGNVSELSDLALLTGAGSFYSYGPSGQGMAIRLTDADSTTLSAGMTLLAKLRQVYGGPLHRLQFGTVDSSAVQNQFWVGPYANLPPAIQESFFKNLPTELSVEVPLAKTSTFAVLEGAQWFSQWTDRLRSNAVAPQYAVAQLDMANTLRTSVFAKTAKSDGKELTVITAEQGKVLQKGIDQLVQHGPWSQLQGALAYWDADAPVLRTVSLDDAPFSAYGLRGGLSLLISQHPWRSLVVLMVLVILMALLTRRALISYRRKH